MKKNLRRFINVSMTISICLLAFPTLASGGNTMAIDFNVTDSQYIEYDRTYAHDADMTFCSWFSLDSLTNDGGLFLELNIPYTGKFFWMSYGGTANSSKLYFVAGFSTVQGIWTVSSAESGITTGTPFLMCTTYGNTGTPTIYINGVSKAVVELQAPSGTAPSWTGGLARVGFSSGQTANTSSFDGRILETRVYNRILTAAEVLAIYNGRGCDNVTNGLVFAPMMYGASGLQAFDGATLAAGNKIVDPYSGAYGTPAGNPIGRAETYLIACP